MPLAKSLSNILNENISNLSPRLVAEQMSEKIKESFPDAVGAETLDIYRHIRKHCLHPNVRITEAIRDVHELSEKLKIQMIQQDPETAAQAIDLPTAKTYLAVVNQLTSMYRIGDPNKLTFGNK